MKKAGTVVVYYVITGNRSSDGKTLYVGSARLQKNNTAIPNTTITRNSANAFTFGIQEIEVVPGDTIRMQIHSDTSGVSIKGWVHLFYKEIEPKATDGLHNRAQFDNMAVITSGYSNATSYDEFAGYATGHDTGFELYANAKLATPNEAMNAFTMHRSGWVEYMLLVCGQRGSNGTSYANTAAIFINDAKVDESEVTRSGHGTNNPNQGKIWVNAGDVVAVKNYTKPQMSGRTQLVLHYI